MGWGGGWGLLGGICEESFFTCDDGGCVCVSDLVAFSGQESGMLSVL